LILFISSCSLVRKEKKRRKCSDSSLEDRVRKKEEKKKDVHFPLPSLILSLSLREEEKEGGGEETGQNGSQGGGLGRRGGELLLLLSSIIPSKRKKGGKKKSKGHRAPWGERGGRKKRNKVQLYFPSFPYNFYLIKKKRRQIGPGAEKKGKETTPACSTAPYLQGKS